jgi:hypothetical protein
MTKESFTATDSKITFSQDISQNERSVLNNHADDNIFFFGEVEFVFFVFCLLFFLFGEDFGDLDFFERPAGDFVRERFFEALRRFGAARRVGARLREVLDLVVAIRTGGCADLS